MTNVRTVRLLGDARSGNKCDSPHVFIAPVGGINLALLTSWKMYARTDCKKANTCKCTITIPVNEQEQERVNDIAGAPAFVYILVSCIGWVEMLV